MRRGQVVLVALSGDYGKPRPAVIIQDEAFAEHPTVVVLPCTSHLDEWPRVRIRLAPSEGNGLAGPSEVMVDKPHVYRRDRIRRLIGQLSVAEMQAVDRALATFLGFA